MGKRWNTQNVQVSLRCSSSFVHRLTFRVPQPQQQLELYRFTSNVILSVSSAFIRFHFLYFALLMPVKVSFKGATFIILLVISGYLGAICFLFPSLFLLPLSWKLYRSACDFIATQWFTLVSLLLGKQPTNYLILKK